MKPKRSLVGSLSAGLAAALLASGGLAVLPAAAQTNAQTTAAQVTVAPKHKAAFSAFEARVKEYVAMREGLEGKMPKLPKDAKPEQIEAHKAALQKAVQTARASAKPGDLFEPALAAHIREVIKTETPARLKREVRETVKDS